MKLGILGGTFDPVHFGHLLLAEQCREQCGLDEVWFVPAGTPPHKLARAIAPGRHRAEMLDFAVAGHATFRVERRELDRSGPSFTVETLRELHEEDDTRELFFLLGADSLADLPTWRDPHGLFDLASLVVVNRGDRPPPDVAPLWRSLGADFSHRLRVVSIPAVDLSSSDIRQRVRAGRSIRFMVPRAVECYIETHRLYLPEPPIV
jgi:nicotinate-nucleotide adenylyltransferase